MKIIFKKNIKHFTCVILMSALSACNTVQNSADPNTPQTKTSRINTQLGMAYLQNNDMQRAKQKFLLALDQAPNSPEAWYSMAYFQEVTGNSAKANEAYLKAIQLAPTSGDVQNNYGTFLCRHNQYQNGIKHFLLAINDTRYLHTAGAYENAGLCALKIPDLHSAENYFNHAINQDPNMSTSLLELAKLNYHFGHYKEAKYQLEQFLLLSPANAQSNTLKMQLDNRA
ncbi:MAG: type IV pilus biogenesis/stability protein PilW [Gammaproteobacteria bacterium]|nr:type IV pilus biogenesis/stability protein PilW [Gammaproteobacteria bacterium]